ncbi:CDP-alcohol phosphatidyltransferase family protein [Nocardioides coralli]|uniref:CDP-alcohol phosphatidyltransferase family protein n=1 Tax=Nocardioides coralli TaxID=2872154 RepID=UPI0020182768|nr:CDP-alcohol phosphatidyltransferase family protein [Nocardioides coralli]
MTSATVITGVRTVASLALCLAAATEQSLVLLVAGLAVYWVGDILDGAVARWRGCETRIGAVLDIMSDRLNCAAFYLGLCWLDPGVVVPVGVYLTSFMVVDSFLSLAFLAWPIRSPNYFYAVDERIWRWNWSKPAKAVNSSLFAVLLLVDQLWWVAMVTAVALLGLKLVSLRWLGQLGLPVPDAPVPGGADPLTSR